MKLNKLLERQIKKFIPANIKIDESLKDFLHAINDSYNAYERDHELSDRAFKISEEEYIRINKEIKSENDKKKVSIAKLKETIVTLGEYEITNTTDDLLDVVHYLKQQVVKRKEAEAESTTTNNRLSSLIINMQEGILVEDDRRHIALVNTFFCTLFNIPVSPELLTGTDCSNSAEESKHLFNNPEAFVKRIAEIVKEKKLVINEELELADGRFFERDFVPIYINNEYKGHLWKYRDITQRKNATRAIEQSELTNRLIMNGSLDAIVTIDIEGTITYWNPQAEKIFGWKAEEIIGKSINSTIIPLRYRELHKKSKSNSRLPDFGPAIKKIIEVTAATKDGKEFPAELSIVPIRVDNSIFFCSFIRDISERKKAEEKLKASEELWQFALEGAGDGVWEYNFITKEVFFSAQYKKMLGYEDDEFANEAGEWLSRIHPDDVAIIYAVDEDYFNKKITSHQREYRILHKDGHYRWILDRGMVVNYSSSGQPQRIIGTHTDITSRKQNEEELKRLALVASGNKNGVIFTDIAGKITWCNDGFCNTTGFAPDEVIGKTPIELMYGERTDEENLQKMVDLFFTGKNFDVELICYRKNKTWFWARSKGQSVLDKEGNVLQYFAILEDITTEKETQQKIAEFEFRFRKALEQIGDNVWEHDVTTGKTFFSNAFAGISAFNTGNTENNATLWWNRVVPEDRKMLERNDLLYKTGKIDHHILEYRIMAQNGREHWVLDRGVVIEKDKDGLPLKIVGTHTDITERKLAEQLLQINEQKYRSIIANMNLGLLEVDKQELIQYANQSFCNMSGYEVSELIGRKASMLFTRGENSEMIETKNDLRKKGISDAYEIAMKNKRGELRWWLISGAPRFDDKGNLVGSIGIHLDITEQKQLEMELHDAREAAEQSARTKELFLANMSHEIRTPMNAILGMARQMNKTSLNSTQHFYLDTINKAADNLLVVINDILDISKIEAGKLSLENIGFRADEVIRHCMTVMSHRAEEKGLTLKKQSAVSSFPVFIGDPYRLTQILLNLISNAVKFTDKGGITIACNLLPAHDNHQTLELSVIDTGIGMDEAFLSKLFQKFTQEEKTTARKYGGTGLGMSISKQLIELMKGSIAVTSKKNEGTTITITIPFAVGTAADIISEDTASIDTAILQGKNILLVEDNEMNRLVATTVLDGTGVIVTEAENGLEAVKLLQQNQYDLVLMDVQMPVMDGLEATQKIRQELKNAVPIIALTANAIKGESDRCRNAGMNDFLSKPFEENDLIQKLCRWLGGNTAEGEPANPVSVVKAPVKNEKLYDLTSLKKISQGNEGFLKKMIALFAQQVPQSVQEMKEALDNKEFEKVRAIAHKIKPAIDNMGISTLHKTIRDIEKNATNKPDIFLLKDDVAITEQVISSVTAQLNEEPVLN